LGDGTHLIYQVHSTLSSIQFPYLCFEPGLQSKPVKLREKRRKGFIENKGFGTRIFSKIEGRGNT
jgi:hypothetical protein